MSCQHLFLLSFLVLCPIALSDRPAPSQYGQPQYAPAAPPEPKKNCTVEFVKNTTEVCVPTLQTDCQLESVPLVAPKKEEKCITVTTTNCKAEVEEKEIELCVYVYEKKDLEAKAKVVDVKYTKRCDTSYVEVCVPKPKPAYPPPKPKSAYGQPEEEEEEEEQDCKEVPQEVCFNKPQVDNKEKTVNVRVPQPVRKCIKKKVQIPTVTCEDNKEQRCFELVTLEQTEQEIEKCHTIVGPQECQKVTLNLPSQVCVDEKSGYGRY